jgi:hypothetical protein
MSDWVSIALSADEILDHVDEMLAWEAIAGCASMTLCVPHFRKAVPFLKLGRGVYGVLTPSSIEAKERDIRPDGWELFEFEALRRNLPATLEEFPRIQYARIVEHDPKDDVVTNVPVQFHEGDGVSDMVSGDGGSWRGVRFHIESIGEITKKESRRDFINRHRLPQVARLFGHQHVLAFRDGRATSAQYVFAMWNRKLWTLHKTPLGHDEAYAHDFSWEPAFVADAIAHERARESLWNVELSLSRDRTGVALQTDAIGAREIVNMLRGSDTPKGRRKTLVHWVEGHMRRRRKLDAAAEVKVRAHMRGMGAIDAGRYHARIWPATSAISEACNGEKYDHGAAT